MGARAAGPRRESVRRSGRDDPGADHPRPGHLRRRDPAAGRPRPEDPKKKYLQVAVASLLTRYFLGDRDLASFRTFIYSDLHGSVIVTTGTSIRVPAGAPPLCCQHLLSDLKDAAESYPDAIWPGQVADALRGLIHQANLARDQGLASVPDEGTAEHLRLFRNGVSVGLSQVRRIPGGTKVEQPPARMLLECLRDRRPTCSGSLPTPPSRPLQTRLIMPSSGLCGHGAGCPGTRARLAG